MIMPVLPLICDQSVTSADKPTPLTDNTRSVFKLLPPMSTILSIYTLPTITTSAPLMSFLNIMLLSDFEHHDHGPLLFHMSGRYLNGSLLRHVHFIIHYFLQHRQQLYSHTPVFCFFIVLLSTARTLPLLNTVWEPIHRDFTSRRSTGNIRYQIHFLSILSKFFRNYFWGSHQTQPLRTSTHGLFNRTPVSSATIISTLI
jgi:hypothetical protein